MLTSVWIALSLFGLVTAFSQPPRIVWEPDYDVYYKSGETVYLPCLATGEPRPQYRWRRNEKEFVVTGYDGRLAQIPNEGTLVFNSPEDKDEAIFQCFAVNSFGTSVSKKINLRKAKLKDFAKAPPLTYTPRIGEPLTLPCLVPESVPPANVVWINKRDTGGFDVYNYDEHVSVDREFNLRFTNVRAEDRKGGLPYACVALNRYMRKSTQGPLHFINPRGSADTFAPVKYLWADQYDRFGLRGETFSMKCIFSGNPTPDVHWERVENTTLPDRAFVKSFEQELEIRNLQFEDEGNYTCWATNSVREGHREMITFTVRVNSKPYFIQEPKDIETTVGTNAEFTCLAHGKPVPDIEWYINGVPLKDVTDPRIKGDRFKQPSENKIILENVQLTDPMVIQCNASNIYGYAFSNVYLNVLATNTPNQG